MALSQIPAMPSPKQVLKLNVMKLEVWCSDNDLFNATNVKMHLRQCGVCQEYFLRHHSDQSRLEVEGLSTGLWDQATNF